MSAPVEAPTEPFTWLTVHPDQWYRTTGSGHQRCGTCGQEMANTLITNARGGWEHYECATRAWRWVHDGGSTVPEVRGTQRQMTDHVQAHPRTPFVVTYVENDRGKSQRWGWRPL